MIKFLKKILMIILAVPAVFFVSFSVCKMWENTYFANTLPENSLAIIGNSHPKCAINDSILTSQLNLPSVNYGVNGQAMFWSIVGGRKLCNQGIKFCVIEISNNTYSSHHKSIIRGRAMQEINKKYYLKTEEWINLAQRDLPLTIDLFTYQSLPRSRVRGSYEPNNRIFNNKIVKENYEKTKKSDNNYNFDDKIVHDFIKENPDVFFFIVRVPQHPSYYQLLKESSEKHFAKRFSDFDKYENSTIIDFGKLYTDDSLFGDLSHMSKLGAEKFTQVLADSITARISER